MAVCEWLKLTGRFADQALIGMLGGAKRTVNFGGKWRPASLVGRPVEADGWNGLDRNVSAYFSRAVV